MRRLHASDISEIKKKLLHICERELQGFDPNAPLLQQANSLQIYALVPLLESEFGMHIHSMEITGNDFHSIHSLAELLARKMRARAAAL